MGTKILQSPAVTRKERKEALEYLRHIDRDPGYQAIRLRGLAGLLRGSGDGRLQELTNFPDVMFFLASELDEIAGALDGEN